MDHQLCSVMPWRWVKSKKGYHFPWADQQSRSNSQHHQELSRWDESYAISNAHVLTTKMPVHFNQVLALHNMQRCGAWAMSQERSSEGIICPGIFQCTGQGRRMCSLHHSLGRCRLFPWALAQIFQLMQSWGLSHGSASSGPLCE